MAVYVCENHTDAVLVYDSRRKCPFCAVENSIEEQKEEIESLQREIDNLKDKTVSLEAALASAKSAE